MGLVLVSCWIGDLLLTSPRYDVIKIINLSHCLQILKKHICISYFKDEAGVLDGVVVVPDLGVPGPGVH